jgi:hypothetical protein
VSKIYIAGTFGDQKALREIATKVWELGHEVTGTWLHEVKKPADMDQRTFQKKLAIKDMCEVARADLLIVDNRQSSGGKNAEMGMALWNFQHMQVWLVGPVTNVFQVLADREFANWDECLAALAQ